MNQRISLHNVSKRYENDHTGVLALEGMSLDVQDGEIVCVVGPSGCGKTTLINLVAGFTTPTSGLVMVDGEMPMKTRTISGVVFQSDAVFPWMSVGENIGYGLRHNRTPRSNRMRVVAEYLALTGLSDQTERWPRDLSGGMRKRVELARAYAADPPLLLLDEPFGSLDVMTREVMQTVLLRIWEQHRKSVLLVTHDIEEALFLGHRVVVMTPRPGSVSKVVDVPFAFPRETGLKLTTEFLALRQRVIAGLVQPNVI